MSDRGGGADAIWGGCSPPLPAPLPAAVAVKCRDAGKQKSKVTCRAATLYSRILVGFWFFAFKKNPGLELHCSNLGHWAKLWLVVALNMDPDTPTEVNHFTSEDYIEKPAYLNPPFMNSDLEDAANTQPWILRISTYKIRLVSLCSFECRNYWLETLPFCLLKQKCKKQTKSKVQKTN